MKHLMTLIALVVAVTAGAQVMDTILTGNTVNMNLNYAKLDSIIADLQAKVATLEAAQTSAFDGTYGSLTGAPAIPSNVSDLTNDAGFTTFDGAYSSLSDLPSMAWVNLFGRDLIYAELTNAYLTYANLTSANLTFADLTNANLTNANLDYANLANADLSHADLDYANLSFADLTNADLTNVDLTNANLTGVTWTGAYILNCIGCSCTDANNDNYCD